MMKPKMTTRKEELPESQPEPEHIQRLLQSPPGEPGALIEFRIGPLPPPNELQQYEKILPGFTDRSMKIIEDEQRAQTNVQNQMLSNERLRINWSGVTTILAIISGVVLAWLGYPLPGVVFGLGGTLFGTIRFIIRRFFNGQG
ncbi:MAG: DUF2335 domain-containing protein [Nitrospira sp. SB0661_bin_20]|nr:DUF2335 domain-containing protein [Nitrospira sp. SB0661_bin_20]